jgi:hypothetical protein
MKFVPYFLDAFFLRSKRKSIFLELGEKYLSKCQYFLLYIITDLFPTDCKHWIFVLQIYNPSRLLRRNDTIRSLVCSVGLISQYINETEVRFNYKLHDDYFKKIQVDNTSIHRCRIKYCDLMACDHRRVLDWWSDLLDPLIHNAWLHFTLHSWTYTSVHSHVFTAVAW